jgi:hypothetical protein
MRRLPSYLLISFGFALSGAAQAVDVDHSKFETWAKREAQSLRDSPQFKTPYCHVDAAISGNTIIRSPPKAGGGILKPGDKILAVGESMVDLNEPTFVVKILKVLRPTETVSLTLKRGNTTLHLEAPCQSTATNVLPRIAALEAAASGDFRICYTKAKDDNLHLVKAFTFSLETICGKYAGQLSEQEVAVRQAQYWSLRFDDIKPLPDALERAKKWRPTVLADVTALENAGQPRLASELERMLAVASGIPPSAPRAASVDRKYQSPAIRDPGTSLRRSRGGSGSKDCESGHWIESVTDDGEIVKLEDGSLWEVSAGDTVDSALWLPATEIVACGDRLINTEDNEKVDATRIR